MALSNTDRVQKLIDRINNDLDHDDHTVYWYGPTSETRIIQAEKLLGRPFPLSFRFFLSSVGGGGIESLSILGIPAKGNIRNSGSVCGSSDHWREDWVPEKLPEHLLVIQECDDDNEPFCLDFSRMKKEECPVVLYYPWNGDVEDIAPSFIDFWESYCEPYFAPPKPIKKKDAKRKK